MKIGYMLSSEQFAPDQLLDQAKRAHDAGFEAIAISDHFHPGNEAQGDSPFVWSVIGALAEALPGTPVTTMVTCPTFRVHPVVLAQAAATSAALLGGRFVFGVGTGENLNEHVTGAQWPPAGERMDRLREAVDLMRRLWGGGSVDYDGRYYCARSARIYTQPDAPPPVYVSGFGPAATKLAAEIGDGFITVVDDLLDVYRAADGKGPLQTAMKVCYGREEAEAIDVAHRMWATELLPGQLNQELRTPGMFEDATSLVAKRQTADAFPCGPDLARHLDALAGRIRAGYDEVYVQQIGPEMEGFFSAYADEVLPSVRRLAAA